MRHEWANTSLLRANVELDAYVIMPNHVHAILWVVDAGKVAPAEGTAHRAPTPARFGVPAPNAPGTIVGGFKSAVTKRARLSIGPASLQVWQRNYYEHVVRDEAELQRIRQYIIDNPAAWADDEENPERISPR